MSNAPKPWHFDHSADEVTIYADNDWPIARMLEPNDRQFARLIVSAVNAYDGLAGTRAHLLQMMLDDALDSVKVIYGDEGLKNVVGHMSAVNKAREHNAELDEIEKNLCPPQQ
mgnify:CR=1 FL=1